MYGYGYRQDFRRSGVSYNANAQLVFNAVGDVPEVVKPFYSDLFQDFEDSGVWDNANFWAILCVPSLNQQNTLIEVKSLTVVSSFYGSTALSPPYNNARDVRATFAGYSWRTGGSGYIRTGFIPNVKQTLNDSSIFMVTFGNETAVSSFNYGALNSVSQTNVFTTRLNTNAVIGDSYSTTIGTGRISVAGGDGAAGVYINNRRSTSYASIVKNGTVIGSIIGNNGSLPSIECYLNTYNNAGSPTTRRNQSPIAAWGSFGSGLTAQQETDLSTALINWQTSMERKTGLHTKQVVLDGNSHTVYWLAQMDWATQYDMIVSGWKFTNVGVSGQTTTQMSSDYASEVAPLYSGSLTKNMLILVEGTNAMWLDGKTKDQAISDMAALVSAAQATGFTVGVKKQFCRVNPTSGAGLATYPTVTAWNLAVSSYNDDVDAGLTGADFVIDASSNHFISKNDYASDALYNTAVSTLLAANTLDGTHLLEAGYTEEGHINALAIQNAP